jgi:hypothetical protein
VAARRPRRKRAKVSPVNENEKVSRRGSMTSAEMGRKRWAQVSSEERKEALAKARAHINLSPEQRSQIARHAIQARWEKWRAEHAESDPKAKSEAQTHATKPSSSAKGNKRSVKQTGKPVSIIEKELKPRKGGHGDTLGGTTLAPLRNP